MSGCCLRLANGGARALYSNEKAPGQQLLAPRAMALSLLAVISVASIFLSGGGRDVRRGRAFQKL
jgi:hypothetical protein